ncbi:MAG: LPXTG cell wall anchor domain-containing protein [Collinsella sp.]
MIEITNTHLPMLPETGGAGTWLAVLAGGMLLACAAYERRRRSISYTGYAPAHFATCSPPWLRLGSLTLGTCAHVGALQDRYLSRRRSTRRSR